MKLTCFFVQRTCRYPGQHAPELFGAVDEVTANENPDYTFEIKMKMIEMLADNEIESWQQIAIEIDDDQFEKAFNPGMPVIAGNIAPVHHQTQSKDSHE